MVISLNQLSLIHEECALFKVSVPGSIMLLGEHAVLYGYPAIVCAINRRISITLQSRTDDIIIINTESFGKYETTIKKVWKKPLIVLNNRNLMTRKSHFQFP